ncbi:DUF6584 family protein [Chryseobacterium indoltheticum]|uniref:DUF6584 family protein n=1 Tax=Chryseobacterium indoltheticum TaxID=254 RepID=UPI003F49899F
MIQDSKDEAGKFWILSEPQNFEMMEAVDIYRNSLSNSGNAILKDIVFREIKINFLSIQEIF